MSDNDLQLIERYVRHHAEDAFAEIVRRHLDLVHSAAFRQVRSRQLAEEVAQSVFTDLARSADRLASDTVLTAWLYQVTRRTAVDVVRREARRQLREQIAIEMDTLNANTADWTHIEPLLDEAMSALEETDRTAVLLRYFENRSLREVGQTLGTSDDAAQKRVSRAVERLRGFFADRGVAVGASGIVVAVSANAVQAAPVGLAAAISVATVASVGTTLVATAVPTALAMTILQKTVVTAAVAIAVGAGIHQVRLLRQQPTSLAERVEQLARERADALGELAQLREDNQRLKRDTAELLRLRGEVTELRKQRQAPRNTPVAANGPAQVSPPEALPKEAWTFTGYATPEAAFQSVFWAMSQGDVKTFLASLTPEARQSMSQKSEQELAEMLREEMQGRDALRLDWKRDSTEEETTFVLHTRDEDNGVSKFREETLAKFKKVAGEWRYAP